MAEKAASPANAPSGSPAPAARSAFWQKEWVNTLGRFAALVAIFVFFALMVEEGNFYKARNLEAILRQSAVYATAALGMTLVVIAGGIDLSIGSVIALTMVMVAWILDIEYQVTPPGGGEPVTVELISRWPRMLPLFAVAGAVVAATLAGLANGLMIVRFRVVPFIVTLGTMGIFRGLAKGVANEKDIYPPDTWITDIMQPTVTKWWSWATGSGEQAIKLEGFEWLILPLGVWILMASAVAAALLLRYTRLGRHIYAIGSSEETARLCGVPVARTKVVVYMLAGFFGGLAGLMEFSFVNGYGQPSAAVGYELFIIAAVVIGGGSLSGGEGSILGSLIGALMITILYMGGRQIGLKEWHQQIAIGAIIIGAVALDQLRHRRVSY